MLIMCGIHFIFNTKTYRGRRLSMIHPESLQGVMASNKSPKMNASSVKKSELPKELFIEEVRDT